LQNCDAVVYDRLVHPILIPHDPYIELYDVGKCDSNPCSPTQEAINTLLISLAAAGKRVVRLKGGDPFVFGRGGEEAHALAEAGVPFEVVPGVTAGIAGPAYAGIPVTYRSVAHAVTFVTGHTDPRNPAKAPNWRHLARLGETIVVYMGAKNLELIVNELLVGGIDPETPTATIHWATYAGRQQTVTATLATIVDRTRAAKLIAPVVTVIGNVVALRDHLRWFVEVPI
jgi:uroporphyrinogen III methyltransferase/synthase